LNELEQAVADPLERGGMCTLVIFISSSCAHIVDLGFFIVQKAELRVAVLLE
jgi:hypothetical protein